MDSPRRANIRCDPVAAFQTNVQQVFSDGAGGAENKQVHNQVQVRCRIDVSDLVQLIQCKERANHDGENNHGLYNSHHRITAVEFRNGGRDKDDTKTHIDPFLDSRGNLGNQQKQRAYDFSHGKLDAKVIRKTQMRELDRTCFRNVGTKEHEEANEGWYD